MATRDVWIVFATAPAAGWVYKPDHFPRTFNYKKDAKTAAEGAKGQGGINVEVVKQDKKLAEILGDSRKLRTHYIVRCERDQCIFGQEVKLDAVDRKQYDPVGGDRSLSCPRCGRSYYYHNGGEIAEGKVGWHSDRPLTVLYDPTTRQRGVQADDGGRADRGSGQRHPPEQRRVGPGNGSGTPES